VAFFRSASGISSAENTDHRYHDPNKPLCIFAQASNDYEYGKVGRLSSQLRVLELLSIALSLLKQAFN